MKEIEKIITSVWDNIDIHMNTENRLMSSEKSIVFNFAWLILENCPSNVKIDFETTLFDKFSDGKYIDLYIIYTDENGKEINVGIEVKFPKQIEKNGKTISSDRTEKRQAIINDIKRLNYLVQKNSLDIGCFLCVTNESSYTLEKSYKKAENCLTHHGKKYERGKDLPNGVKHSETVKALNEIIFNWKYFKKSGKKHSIDDNKSYIFLEPIFIKR